MDTDQPRKPGDVFTDKRTGERVVLLPGTDNLRVCEDGVHLRVKALERTAGRWVREDHLKGTDDRVRPPSIWMRMLVMSLSLGFGAWSAVVLIHSGNPYYLYFLGGAFASLFAHRMTRVIWPDN